jgi:hypothetical protein
MANMSYKSVLADILLLLLIITPVLFAIAVLPHPPVDHISVVYLNYNGDDKTCLPHNYVITTNLDMQLGTANKLWIPLLCGGIGSYLFYNLTISPPSFTAEPIWAGANNIGPVSFPATFPAGVSAFLEIWITPTQVYNGPINISISVIGEN